MHCGVCNNVWKVVGWVECNETQHLYVFLYMLGYASAFAFSYGVTSRLTQPTHTKTMRYKRSKIKGGTYFFTVVTYKRQPILIEPDNVELIHDAFKYVMNNYPFNIDAYVLMPDHIHCIWTLPDGDADYSKRWRLLKSYFSRNCNDKHKLSSTESRKRKKEHTIWQRRFWEHAIGDDKDFITHVEYIHYNPVKHGVTKAPKEWRYTSFHKYVDNNKYNVEWGSGIYMKFEEGIGME